MWQFFLNIFYLYNCVCIFNRNVNYYCMTCYYGEYDPPFREGTLLRGSRGKKYLQPINVSFPNLKLNRFKFPSKYLALKIFSPWAS